MKLGQVGTISGPAGNALMANMQGAQLWAKWVNSRGGVAGHPVELIVADDGGDPARHRALVQEMVESRGVIAFVNNLEPFSGSQSAVDYVTSKRVPVIGMTGGEQYGIYTSPMYFPQHSSGPALSASMFASAAQQSKANGKSKLGVLTCTEAPTCRQMYDQAEQQLGRRGVQVVFKAQASIAQPDFTAECLAARNANVEVIFVVLDANSVRRLAKSCSRQAFRPFFFTAANAVVDDEKDEPDLDGRLIANSTVFPWFQSGTPASDEHQAALRQYGANVKKAGGVAMGWVSGKLVERAATRLGAGPPTSEALLRGLWSITNDDLGGLTAPLRFIENQPAPEIVCWWNIAIVNRSWTSPNAYQRSCE